MIAYFFSKVFKCDYEHLRAIMTIAVLLRLATHE